MIAIAIALDIILILFSLKYAWWYPSADIKKTRIMMYHMISNQLPNSKKSGLRVSPSMFEKHLKYFLDNNWKFIKMSELDDYLDQEKVVAITFDDGYLDNYTSALPLLKKYKAKAITIKIIIIAIRQIYKYTWRSLLETLQILTTLNKTPNHTLHKSL